MAIKEAAPPELTTINKFSLFFSSGINLFKYERVIIKNKQGIMTGPNISFKKILNLFLRKPSDIKRYTIPEIVKAKNLKIAKDVSPKDEIVKIIPPQNINTERDMGIYNNLIFAWAVISALAGYEIKL